LRIVASKAGGEQGSSESQPLVFHWRWYYHVPSWPLGGLIFLLLLVPKANRNRQAWLILAPLGLVLLVWRMPLTLLSAPPSPTETLGFFVVSGAMAWSVVWLLGHRLGTGHRVVTSLLLWAVMFALGLASYFCHFEDTEELAPVSISYAVLVLILLAAMMLAGRRCRKTYAPRRFLLWHLAWLGVLTLTLPLAFLATLLATGAEFRLVLMVLPITAMSLFLGGILCLVNLPFLVLAFKCPLYQERFQKLFRVAKAADVADDRDEPFDAGPLSTAPTTKQVTPDDVLGQWQFYLDSASRSVILDFRPDGTFVECIVPIQGATRECPAGTWKLEGPLVHLAGYVMAAQGVSQSCTWWLIDTPSGLALFGGDGPDGKSFFRLTRRQRFSAVPSRDRID
jgi:hypothetical protein